MWTERKVQFEAQQRIQFDFSIFRAPLVSYSALVVPYKELEETANEIAAQHALGDDVIEAVLC